MTGGIDYCPRCGKTRRVSQTYQAVAAAGVVVPLAYELSVASCCPDVVIYPPANAAAANPATFRIEMCTCWEFA